jgi:asparagine synthase (glutamine-hydrolysing)
MCGIAGAVGLAAPPDDELVERVLESLAHRGPGHGGQRYREGCWLGFRRLPILDLSARADQPMVDDASGVAVVYNGEIYNYLELREELEAKGHRFRTTGDTEVLLHAYVEWGTRAFARCNGMWAVAIDDPRHEGVLLARDRFGEKPLHVGRAADGSWWFASELRPLVVAGAGSGRLDRSRALGFLVLGDVEDPCRSYVEGIEQVPPGAHARLTARGLSSPTQWFDVHDLLAEGVAGGPRSPEEVLDQLDTSVRLRLRSDVPVGTSLSGGIDSSSVVASLRAVAPEHVLHTFTASFPARAIDEWERAALVGEQFGVVLHRVEPTVSGLLDDLDRLVDHQGGPVESPTVYAQWCVMREAHREGITVLLDGQGADETWGGYPKYVNAALGESLTRPTQAVRLYQTWERLGSRPRLDPRQPIGLIAPMRARAGLRAALVRTRARALGPAFDGVRTADPQGAPGEGGLLARAATADLERVILPRLLRYADRNSMAFSRELRLPFLDPDVVRSGLGSGWSEGFRSGWTKALLRRAAALRLPDEIVWRRDKTAYETPDADWEADAGVGSAITAATYDLHAAGLLAAPELRGLNPWRVLSLARFLDCYGLRP